MEKKTVAITVGDPCGIGPEIVLKAVSNPEIQKICNPLIFGNRILLKDTAKKMNIGPFSEEFWEKNIYDVNAPEFLSEEIGTITAKGGQLAFDSIKAATEYILTAGGLSPVPMVTAPINKESLKAAKIPFIGHTEILGGLTGTNDPLTMFETLGLRVFFLTRHVSLRQACDMITENRLLDYIKRCTEALKKIGITKGTMAIAGLNPHNGEHGLFGNEEEAIYTAVAKARAEGYDVEGPIGPDSVFHLAKIGRFNSVLSLYHDQGHIATKTLDFERTIAITHGLPFLRVSVDHGTAFDIAGKGIASPISMEEAIKVAIKY